MYTRGNSTVSQCSVIERILGFELENRGVLPGTSKLFWIYDLTTLNFRLLLHKSMVCDEISRQALIPGIQ